MNALFLTYQTSCGHWIEVKPVRKKGGVDQWQCHIRSPTGTKSKSNNGNNNNSNKNNAVKIVYSHANEMSARAKIAYVLKIPAPSIQRVFVSKTAAVSLQQKIHPSTGIPAGVVSPGRRRRKGDLVDLTELSDPILATRLELRETLRSKRKELAAERPACCVFDNKTLDEIVIRLPCTIAELRTIRGIGPFKCQQYGQAIINVIRQDRQSILANVKQENDKDEIKKEDEVVEKEDEEKPKTEAAKNDQEMPATEAAEKEEGMPATEAAAKEEGMPTDEAAEKEEGMPTDEAAEKEEEKPEDKAAENDQDMPANEEAEKEEEKPEDKAAENDQGMPANEAAMPADEAAMPADEAAMPANEAAEKEEDMPDGHEEEAVFRMC